MKTQSKLISRLLSLALCLCMVLALLPAIPSTANAALATKVYMMPNSNWTQSNAWFAAYFFYKENNNSTREYWSRMTDTNGDGIYEVDVPGDKYTSVIFCRMNPASSSMNWSNKWNQTGDLSVPTDSRTLFTVASGTWDGATTSWGNPSCDYAGHYMINNKCDRCSKTTCQIDGHTFGADNKCTRCSTEGQVIYFQNDWLWTNVQLYYWNDKGNNGWPGEPMLKYEGAARSDSATAYDYYYMVVPKDFTNIIISGTNDKGENVQSVDIPASTYFDGVTYCMFWDENLTVNKNSYKTFAICEDFPSEHKIGADNICSRCKKSVCKINGHEFDYEGDLKCVNCGLLMCQYNTHDFNEVDLCNACGEKQIWVYFENNWKWENIHLYYWYDGVEVKIAWPGVKMELWRSISTGGSSVSYYKVQVPADIDGFIINGIDNSKDTEEDKKQQTPNLTGDLLYNGVTFKMKWVDGNQIDETYDIDSLYPCTADHTYGETQYVWNDDSSECTASRACTKCNKVQSITEGSTGWLAKPGTCIEQTQGGRIVYFERIYWGDAQETIVYEGLDPNNHNDLYGMTVRDNQDGTHTELWGCCLQPSKAPEAHIEDVKDGYCDECGALMAPAQLLKTSVSMKGNIAVNYFMLLTEEVLNDPSAYMQFTLEDDTVYKIPAADGEPITLEGQLYYMYTCEVSAKEMTDEILSQFFYGETSTPVHPYTVQTYAKHILEKYDDQDTKDLILAMVNYGAAAQLHFGYKTERLANDFLDAAPDYSDVVIEGFNVQANQGTSTSKFYSASLILKSETTVRFFFTGYFGAYYNGEYYPCSHRGGLYYIDIVGISAKDLDEGLTLEVHTTNETAEVTFNPMAYCQGVKNDTTGAFGDDMKDLACALYLYNQAANKYFQVF